MLEKRSQEILGNGQRPILIMRAVTRKSSKESRRIVPRDSIFAVI